MNIFFFFVHFSIRIKCIKNNINNKILLVNFFSVLCPLYKYTPTKMVRYKICYWWLFLLFYRIQWAHHHPIPLYGYYNTVMHASMGKICFHVLLCGLYDNVSFIFIVILHFHFKLCFNFDYWFRMEIIFYLLGVGREFCVVILYIKSRQFSCYLCIRITNWSEYDKILNTFAMKK